MDALAGPLHILSLMVIPFLFAVTLHEAGHAYASDFLGDPTPRSHGRLSLNPLTHIDPVGTIMIPLVAILASIPFLIGYAKPVMIEPRYYKSYRRDMILVSLAGPAGNIIVAIFFAYILRFSINFGFGRGDWVFEMAQVGVFLNCLFMLFNLLPIPPLDGSKVVMMFLPRAMAIQYEKVAPFGFFILMGLIIFAKDIVLVPTILFTNLIFWLVGVGG